MLESSTAVVVTPSPGSRTYSKTEVRPSARPKVRGITIDSSKSKDLDDAIWADKNEQGWYLATISVTDVAQTVLAGSPSDKVAAEKVETLYQRGFVTPMLPRYLSEDRLSLLPQKLRATLTFTITLNPDGEVFSFEVTETLLASKAKLSHEDADGLLLKKDEKMHRVLSIAQELSEKLYAHRREKGALAFYDAKAKTYTDEEGNIRTYRGKFFHAQMIIQEFMILANQAAAQFLIEREVPAIFRNHKARLAAPAREEVMRRVNSALLAPEQIEGLRESMSLWFGRAEYSTTAEGHFGLNLPAYMHVTSPIRRYVDLLNQRALKAAIAKQPHAYTAEQMKAEAERLNQWKQERRETQDAAFKERAAKARRLAREEASVSSIATLSRVLFTGVIKQAVLDGVMPEPLVHEIERRAEQSTGPSTLVPMDFYWLIFRGHAKADKEKFAWVRAIALAALSRMPNEAVSILEIMQARDGHSYAVHYAPHANATWTARAHVTDEAGVTLATLQVGSPLPKGQARAWACFLWLEAYTGGRLVPMPLSPHVLPEGTETTGVNPDPVARLNEWFQRNSMAMPEFFYSSSGKSHEPTFHAQLVFLGHTVQAYGATKKEAKAKVCAQMYDAVTRPSEGTQ